MWNRSYPRGHEVALDGCERKAVVHYGGLYIPGSDGGAVSVKQLQFESGKMIEASKYGQEEEEIELHLTPEEEAFSKEIKVTALAQSLNKHLTFTYCLVPCQHYHKRKFTSCLSLAGSRHAFHCFVSEHLDWHSWHRRG